MIKINDYSVLGFLHWQNRKRQTNDFLELSNESLIEHYLEYNCNHWNLKFFIKLFQDFTLLYKKERYNNLPGLFNEFCKNKNLHEYLIPESIDKRPFLRPLLYNFLVFLDNSNYYENINRGISQIGNEAYSNRQGLGWWLNRVIIYYGSEILSLFQIYFSEYLISTYLAEYESWLNKKRDFTIHSKLESFNDYSIENRKTRLINEFNKDCFVEQRLHYSVKLPDSFLICKLDEYTYIDFIQFLKDKDIDISKHIPRIALNKFINDYCEKNPSIDKKKLLKFGKSIINNKSWLLHIMSGLLNNKVGNQFSLDRFYSCKIHSILLFRKCDKLSSFIEKYWKDLHELTSNTLDIYFTNKDLKHDSCCYEVIKNLSYIKVEADGYPCFLVWQAIGKQSVCIPLKGLNHEDMFNVIEHFTSQVEKYDFDTGVLKAIQKAASILESKKPVVKNINTTYDLRNSQNGAVGDNAVSNGNIFNKNLSI
jgi:hypothetical protein